MRFIFKPRTASSATYFYFAPGIFSASVAPLTALYRAFLALIGFLIAFEKIVWPRVTTLEFRYLFLARPQPKAGLAPPSSRAEEEEGVTRSHEGAIRCHLFLLPLRLLVPIIGWLRLRVS
jgi:hypothetical protein